MDKFPWILSSLLGIALVAVVALLAYFKSKLTKTKSELENTTATLDKQREIVKAYNSVSEIQQEVKTEEKTLTDAVKGVRTSAEPIKESVALGNDIVSSWNNKLQDNKKGKGN